MIASAHQPHFLPWLGYINKVVHSETFIWLDTVQYRKNYFQNRSKIMGRDGREQWLTLPVHAHLDTPISEVTIADARWRVRVEKTIEQAYSKAPHFAESWPALKAALHEGGDHLNEVNWRLLRAVLGVLGLPESRVVRASDLGVDAADPTERLVALCGAVGATQYIAGKGGRGYMDMDAFDRAGIQVLWQEFDVARTAYRRPAGEEVAGLSVIDSLFHLGAARTLEVATEAWTPAVQETYG
jgi:hypothetical protein